MKKSVLIFILVIVSTLIFAVSGEAKGYYLAGIRAYQMQDCVNAIKWFEKALVEDSSIEEYDPQVKFKIGYCAYLIGDYEMAKDYLSLYPDNPVAVSLLKSIGKAKESEAWKKWINIPKENQTVPATSTEKATQVESNKKSSVPFKAYLMILGIFLVIYVSIFFLELKTGIITKFMMKLMGGTVQVESLEVKQVAEEIKKEEKEESSERELEFDLEEILNAPLDTVDKLIYGDSMEVEQQEEKTEVKEEKQQPEGVSSQEEYDSGPEAESSGKGLEEGSSENVENEIEKAEKTEKEVVIEELSYQEEKETLTEEDEDEVMKRANEIFKDLENAEESLPVDLADKSIEEIMEELEEKDSYSSEDAEAFMFILDNLIHGQEVEKEAKEEANS